MLLSVSLFAAPPDPPPYPNVKTTKISSLAAAAAVGAKKDHARSCAEGREPSRAPDSSRWCSQVGASTPRHGLHLLGGSSQTLSLSLSSCLSLLRPPSQNMLWCVTCATIDHRTHTHAVRTSRATLFLTLSRGKKKGDEQRRKTEHGSCCKPPTAADTGLCHV